MRNFNDGQCEAIQLADLRVVIDDEDLWAHMIATGTLPPEMSARAIENIQRNAKAQAQLIEDLLDLSGIVTGKLRLRWPESTCSMWCTLRSKVCGRPLAPKP